MRGTNGESEEEDVFFGSYSAVMTAWSQAAESAVAESAADSAAGNQPAGAQTALSGGGQYKMAVPGRR